MHTVLAELSGHTSCYIYVTVKLFYYVFQVAYLCLIGGSTTNDCVSRIMGRVIDDKLLKTAFTYYGRSEGKHAFACLKLKSVVIGNAYI